VCVERENVKTLSLGDFPGHKKQHARHVGRPLNRRHTCEIIEGGRGTPSPPAAAEVLSWSTRIKVGNVTHKTSELHRRRAGCCGLLSLKVRAGPCIAACLCVPAGLSCQQALSA
jgi:hypothetical protein